MASKNQLPDNNTIEGDTAGSGQKEIDYPTGQVHSVTLYAQSQSSQLFDKIQDSYSGTPTNDNPASIGKVNPSWASEPIEVGVFEKGTEYGTMDDEKYARRNAIVIQIYDPETGEIASIPETCRIEIHRRQNDLVYSDGNSKTYPAGWKTGKTYEGVGFTIDINYINSVREGLSRAFDLIDRSTLPIDAEPISLVDETIRFDLPEVYQRYDKQHVIPVGKTIEQTDRLFNGDDSFDGHTEKNHYCVDRTAIENPERMGFEKTVSSDGLSDTLGKLYLKSYVYKDPRPSDDPLRHPKIEIAAKGAFPAPLFDAVLERLNTVLNAHLADFAAVPAADLIADKYYEGPNQPWTTTVSPAEYRETLKRCYATANLKSVLNKFLYNNRSKCPRDILFVLMNAGGRLSYDTIATRTGITKQTIGKWANRFNEEGLCDVIHDTVTFVSLQDDVARVLKELFDTGTPFGDLRRELEQRKRERRFNRLLNEFDRTHSRPQALPVEAVVNLDLTDRLSSYADPITTSEFCDRLLNAPP
jgi:hypothetical protein